MEARLNRGYSEFSAGTRFLCSSVSELNDGSFIAHCETSSPIKGKFIELDIPDELLTPVRESMVNLVPKDNRYNRRAKKRAAYREPQNA